MAEWLLIHCKRRKNPPGEQVGTIRTLRTQDQLMIAEDGVRWAGPHPARALGKYRGESAQGSRQWKP